MNADIVWIFLIVTGLLLLGSSRLGHCISIVAFQGALVASLAVLLAAKIEVRILLLGGTILFLKGFLFPKLLTRAIDETGAGREVEPFIGYQASLVFGAAFFLGSLRLGEKLLVPYREVSLLAVSTGLFLAMTGFFLIVARKKAVTQVLGYLTLENGIYAFGMSLAYEAPLVVELGILLDVFAAVFVMGIMLFHIQREFDHIDTDRLTALRD